MGIANYKFLLYLFVQFLKTITLFRDWISNNFVYSLIRNNTGIYVLTDIYPSIALEQKIHFKKKSIRLQFSQFIQSLDFE